MAGRTTNYGLAKPLADEFYDVADANGNMDAIDAQMKLNAGKLDPTGDATNVTASFTAATVRENILGGEKLSLSLGKIKKWLADLGTAAFKSIPASGNAAANEVVIGNDSRLTDSRSASDVSTWAKSATKPSYTLKELGAEKSGAVGDHDTAVGAHDTLFGKKADKLVPAAAGNFAGLDAAGNLLDSGKKAGDFAESLHNHNLAYAAINHKATHSKGGADVLLPSDIGAAVTLSGTATLVAANWTGTAAPFVYSLPIAGITGLDILELFPALSHSDTAGDTLITAEWTKGAKFGAESFEGRVEIYGEAKPSVNIPIIWKVVR
ncbi:MAG: hypothetical protein RSB39_06630, partial [Oscillospiraceae bacterium]